ncbi:phospholipase A2 inhibitor and Ly6/PLAUR domain-containing protein-like [Aquarana catesbeiana]|uniref:phospholipase A2 inhibitor and Ly6/PLAUR domain-containing protein-like n=1 Tax=Aquarana catesbeiana TaxID=8400 RepID=UPI003CC933A3
MNYILAFLVFSGLIATGSAMSCVTCVDYGKGIKNCKGDVQQCENDDDFCVTQKESSKIGTDDIITVRKRCLPAADRDVCQPEPMPLDCGNMTFYLYSECCFEDECNSKELHMPAINKAKNGHQCPTCFAEDIDKCPETKLKDCTGSAKACFDFSGHVQRAGNVDRLYAFKGCADNNLCKIDLTNMPGCKVGSNAKFACTY